jgi:hypothetical protein
MAQGEEASSSTGSASGVGARRLDGPHRPKSAFREFTLTCYP